MNRRDFFRHGALAAVAPAVAAPAADTAWGEQELRTLRAWDVHCHVSTPGATPAARMEPLAAIADRVGIERLCVFMSPPW
jgi:hypothetical protein